jgi:hypothetical protein
MVDRISQCSFLMFATNANKEKKQLSSQNPTHVCRINQKDTESKQCT